jgi:hypothetical protein
MRCAHDTHAPAPTAADEKRSSSPHVASACARVVAAPARRAQEGRARMDAHDAEVAAWLAPDACAAEAARAERDAATAELEALQAPTGARSTHTHAHARAQHAAGTALLALARTHARCCLR